MEFLRLLAAKRGELERQVKTAVNNFVAELKLGKASWQASRVAQRFRITGWRQGEAKEAAVKCFRALMENYGTGDRETRKKHRKHFPLYLCGNLFIAAMNAAPL